MGAGHGHIAELLDRLAAAADRLGDALVAIGLDAIGIDVHDQAADLLMNQSLGSGGCDPKSSNRLEGAPHRAPFFLEQ